MIDRLFIAVLAFTLLIGATLAVADAWFDSRSAADVVQLPAVSVVAKRVLPRIDVASNETTPAQLQ